ncbi:MAG: PQQ-dependent sugar dehydrogenase [Chloroflexota bacterium]
MALGPMLAGVAAITVVTVFHWGAIGRLPSLVLSNSAAVFVALLIALLTVILADFGARRLVPATVHVLGLIDFPVTARRGAAFAIVSTVAIVTMVFGLSRVSALVGGVPTSTPVTDAASAPGPTPSSAPTTSLPLTAVPVPTSSAAPDLSLSLVASGLDQPVFLTDAGDARLFVVERPGRIRILEQKHGLWTIGATFLDITSLTADEGGEQGLLGLAFHANYASNGLFYVVYTDNETDVILAEYRRSSGDRADPLSRRQLMKIREFDAYHNGGWIGFKDGYLYMAVGDGQGVVDNDPYDVGQSTTTWLGKILRIDPLDPDGAGPSTYSVPVTNPLVGDVGLDEIWAWGLRNPWRNSFDRLTGDFWIADVGAGSYEEINRVSSEGGYNFGWRLYEGRHIRSSPDLCSVDCLTMPIIEYKHGDDGCAVVGGYVSRRDGSSIEGSYVYGDFCSGHIWHVPSTYADGDPIPPPLETEFPGTLSSFGEDADGRIYVCTLAGDIWVIDQS